MLNLLSQWFLTICWCFTCIVLDMVWVTDRLRSGICYAPFSYSISSHIIELIRGRVSHHVGNYSYTVSFGESNNVVWCELYPFHICIIVVQSIPMTTMTYEPSILFHRDFSHASNISFGRAVKTHIHGKQTALQNTQVFLANVIDVSMYQPSLYIYINNYLQVYIYIIWIDN